MIVAEAGLTDSSVVVMNREPRLLVPIASNAAGILSLAEITAVTLIQSAAVLRTAVMKLKSVVIPWTILLVVARQPPMNAAERMVVAR